MDAARGPSATAVNSDDTACGALDQLCGMIRKRDKRIGGFGHEQVLQKQHCMAGIWHRGVVAATGQMAGARLSPGFGPNVCEKPDEK